MTPYQNESMAPVFGAFEPEVRVALEGLREMIFDVATGLTEVTGVEESLKWGQPSYAPKPKTGTPIRLGTTKSGQVAVFTHCQTTVMSDFRALAPPEMKFDGNRAVHLSPDMPIPLAQITPLIRAALTYRL